MPRPPVYWERMNPDGKESAETGLLTSFPTDPLEGTSVAIQDSDALKPGARRVACTRKR